MTATHYYKTPNIFNKTDFNMTNLKIYVMAAIITVLSVNVANGQKDTEQSEKSVEIIYGYSFEDNKKDIASSKVLTLQSFEGVVMSDHILLKWRSNLDVNSFIIESATKDESSAFKKIGYTDVSYDFNNELYSFKVITYKPGCNYFRFKVKQGENEIVSKSYMVVAGEPDKHVLTVEAIGQDKKLTFQVKKPEKVSLKLVDKSGTTVKVLVDEQYLMKDEIIFKVLKYDEFKAQTLFLVLEGDSIKESRKVQF